MAQEHPDQRSSPAEATRAEPSPRAVVLMVSTGVALLILLLLSCPRERSSGTGGDAATAVSATGRSPDGEALAGSDQPSVPAPAVMVPSVEAGPAEDALADPVSATATEEGTQAEAEGEPQPPEPEIVPDTELALAPAPVSAEPLGNGDRPRNPYDVRTQRGARSAAAQRGMTADSEAGVDRGLRWLARKQAPSGEWQGDHAVGVAGLATLAFLGAGHTHRQRGPFQGTVERALRWLLSQENRDGSFPRRGTFYEQGIATMAISEAYGMTRDPALKAPAEAALRFVLQNLGPDGGYGYGGAGDDVHVTSFQVMALKSGHLAGYAVPAEAVQRLRQYYARALAPDGTTGYRAGGGTADGIRGLGLPKMPGSPTGTRTAVGLFCRVFLDCDLKGPDVRLIAEVLDKAGPQLANVFQVYDGSYAMYQLGGDYWKRWNQRFRDGVIDLQVRGGEEDGSWPGGRGGTVCNTAMYVMSLEVYYRYLPVNVRGASLAQEKRP